MIISMVKSKDWRTSHKFLIRVFKTVKEAYDIDRKSGTNFWTKEIAKEMENFRLELDKLDGVTINETRKGKSGLDISMSMCTSYLTSI